MEQPEQKIVSLLKRGDESAYRYLYDHHYVLLCRFANDLLQDSFWAETIVEDTIFHIWEIRDNFDIQVSLRSYLLRAVRNRCLNHLQKESQKREIRFSRLTTEEQTVPEFAETPEHPLGVLLEQELENEIIKAVDALPEECKLVFKKSRFEHKKNEDIASELNISVNTVKYHIKKALSSLRGELGHYLISILLLTLSCLNDVDSTEEGSPLFHGQESLILKSKVPYFRIESPDSPKQQTAGFWS